jgi:tetratricopeptide (TPR) repeat protein
MKSKLAIACFALAMTCRGAVAGAVDDCNPGSPSAIILRACTEIIQSANFGSDQKAVAYKFRGLVRLSAGAVQPAIADFTEAIRLKPDAATFAGRGWAKFTDRNLPGSIADYSEAIRLSPTSAGFYVERGHVNIVAGKLDDAIRDLTEALRLDPQNANAFNTRGFAHFKKGDFAQAQGDYDAAIKISPFVAIFYANRGYLREAQQRKQDALADLRHALDLDPSLVEAISALRRLEGAGATRAESARRVRHGKQVAEKSCGRCHAVGAKDVSRDKNATEFRNMPRRYTNLSLRAPIERAITVTHDAMPPFNLSSEEIDAVIAYIDSFVTDR